MYPSVRNVNRGLWCITSLLLWIDFSSGQTWTGSVNEHENRRYLHIPVHESGTYLTSTWHYSIRTRYHQHQDNTTYSTPLLFIRPHAKPIFQIYFTEKNCFQDWATFSIYHLHNPQVVEFRPNDVWPCRVDVGEEDVLICEGKIDWGSAVDTHWFATIGYDCSNTTPPPLDLNYTIRVEEHEEVECYPILDAFSTFESTPQIELAKQTCSKYYKSYSHFNFYGFTQEDVYRSSNNILLLGVVKCYKYIQEALCRVTIPECKNGKVQYFCLEMCEQLREGCKDVPEVMSWMADCRDMRRRETGSCVYKNITCNTKELLSPENGYINVKSKSLNAVADYECDEGYEKLHNSSSTCGYYGMWSPMYASCIPTNMTTKYVDKYNRNAVIIASTISGCVLLLIFITISLAFRYKYEIFILLFKYCRCILCCRRFIGKYEEKAYHAFLAYHEDDLNYAKVKLQECLEDDGFKVFVDYRDGLFGATPIRYIPEAIAKSQGIVVVLSQGFLDDNFCQFVLDQAFYQTLEGDALKIIIIHDNDIKQLKKIPRYLRTGCTKLEMKDPLLIDKIKYELRDFALTKSTSEKSLDKINIIEHI